ncbi:alpha/beta hydrolase [Cupriavidus basilensis]|uniref:alpha/beta hydrolase n=1 Tax=Cupriavidus basilensis TaxID=68895 RepID=UPI0020A6D9DC|nr:alpha/beta hydrolase [Cupriavidus basilensis]MCP3022027.1 alpha/beta hydrolase [Cupriavidus basilensis]
MQPIKTIQIPLTPIEKRAPVKVYLLRPRGTLYWGGAGLDGDYVRPQIEAFRRAGIAHCFAGITNSATIDLPKDYEFLGTLIDAIRSGLTIRSRDDGEWTITSGMAAEATQFNLIGYSYGSLLAAQTAWSYARAGHVIDHLVLVGSPIEAGFLGDLRGHKGIRKTTVINLTEHGDPIYAGMPWAELALAAPLLGKQMISDKGEGHFYYAHVVPDSLRRWAALAQRVAAEGLR